jgi:predicted metal-binding membrane protein
MNILQKAIIISLVLTAGLSWLLTTLQPDMMDIMIAYNPILIGLFTATWTAGMAAMMFPAIIPMVLLYNKLLSKNQASSSSEITQLKFPHIAKVILFVGMYLVIWAITGIVLLLGWSIAMSSIMSLEDSKYISTIVGSVLIVSGIYQFTPLKNKCIGYCESPLSFFMKRWRSGTVGAFKMGAYHGLYCLGCCWPYFLIMVALGWMNLVWMGLFAIIIFGEKMWSKGIWIARVFGIVLIILGVLSSAGFIAPYDNMVSTSTESDITGTEMEMSNDGMNSDTNEGKSEIDQGIVMSEGTPM